MYTILKPFRQAFTMLELVFVIIILGIVASIGSSVIVQVYESYIMQKVIHNANIKTELAINQLANRLAYRIDMSMLARKPGTTGYTTPTDVYPIQNVPLANINNMSLEWIGYDNDSFSATNPPVWSGFVDLNASTFNTVITPGSTLTNLQTIRNNIAGGTAGTPAILFMGEDEYKNGVQYNPLCLYSTNGCISPMGTPTVDNAIPLTTAGNRASGQMYYTEMYQLVSSAYAVITTPATPINSIPVWDLHFKYNYQPWSGDTYDNGNDNILLRNVSVFRFKQEENSLRIKLCVIEQLSQTTQVSICKEKAVIR